MGEKPVEGDTRPRSVVLNVLANYGYFVVGMGTSYLLTPIMNSMLGKPVFNDWLFLVGFSIYFSLADLGLNVALVKQIAHHLGKGELDDAARILTAGLRIFGLIGGAFAVVGITVWMTPSILPSVVVDHLKGIDGPTAATVLGIILLNWMVEMALAPFNAALFAAQRYDVARLIAVVARLGKFVAILALLHAGYGILMLAAVTCGEALLRGLLQTWAVTKAIPNLRIRLTGTTMKTVKSLFTFSVWVIVSNLSYKMILLSDNILVQYVSDEPLAPLYNAAMMPIIMMEQLLWAIAQVLVPYAATKAAQDDPEALRRTVTRATRFTVLMALPMVTYLVVAGQGFIGTWMFDAEDFPVESVLASQPLLYWLAPAFLALFIQQPAIAVLVGTGKIKTPALINLGQALVKIVLSVALGLRYGVVGVAIGTVIPLVIANVFILPRYVKRETGVDWSRLTRGALAPALKTAIIAAPLAAGLLLWIDAGGEPMWRYRYQIPIALAVAGIFGAVSWFTGLAEDDRAWLRARLPGKRG